MTHTTGPNDETEFAANDQTDLTASLDGKAATAPGTLSDSGGSWI